MVWSVVAHVVSFVVDLFVVAAHRSDRDKDLEILLLRHQVRLLQGRQPRPPGLSRCAKLTLAVLAAKAAHLAAGPGRRLDQLVLLFKPETVLKWHRELVRRKWSFACRRPAGRPPIPAELEALIVRLAGENPGWGYSRIHGELTKLGFTVGRSTVRDVLKRQRMPPAPQRRQAGSTWRSFLSRHRDQLLACDFFTVETLLLKTVHVLFFVELGTRRIHLAGCTRHPTAAWVTQQARQLSWALQDGALSARFLIRDRDAKFPVAFDTVLRSEGVTIVRTPYRAPNANAIAERWIRSVREECLDHLLILNEAHLRRVLQAYVAYFNRARPHQGLDQRAPVAPDRAGGSGPIRRRDVLGGLLHEYYRAAA